VALLSALAQPAEGRVMAAKKRYDLVLVVEDQPKTAELTEIMLTEIEIPEVRIAASFAEADQVLSKRDYDLAILDFNMGEAASWSIAKRLCDMGTQIIVTTSDPVLSLPASCGNADVLQKPYSLNDLAALVKRKSKGTAQ
jgi:DNA-binding response OmpR family regulator